MRRIALFVIVMVACFLISCGGGNSSSSSSGTVSKIAKRAFVSNQATSVIEIVDAARDTLPLNSSTQLPFTIGAGSAPTLMVETVDKKNTIVYGSAADTLSVIDNSKEAVTNSVNLRNPTESFAISQDDRFLFVAERNTIASGATSGAVEIFDLNNVSAGATVVSVPGARQLVLSHNGSTLLVFSDNVNTLSLINTSNLAAAPIVVGTTTAPFTFDRPVFAVFSSDDSTAYILSCGSECGGTALTSDDQPKVTAMMVSTQAIGASVNVSAARTALLNGTTLYVAGTNSIGGQLTVLNAATLTPMVAGIAIPDGIHDRINLGSNGKLFIGARACSNITQGCLAIYDTTTNPTTAVIHAPLPSSSGGNLPADVTAIEPIPNRNVVYVCEGGELNIYNTTTSSLQTNPVIDIVGNAIDVKEVF